MKIDLIGAPFNSDGTTPEEENPARALRDLGLIGLLSEKHVVEDHGDIEIPKAEGRKDEQTHILNLSSLQETSRLLAAKLHEILDPNGFSIVLGGDCAILIGIFGALSARNIRAGMVFFDGHADFHSPESSPTGEAADFELAFLTGRGPEEITGLFEKCPLIEDEDIIVYGITEPDLISESNIEVYDKDLMTEIGMEQSVKDGMAKLAAAEIPLWFHFDIDVIDPSLVPVLIPCQAGLTFEQTREFLVQAFGSYSFMGMSVACYHPNLDRDGRVGKIIGTMISDAVHEMGGS